MLEMRTTLIQLVREFSFTLDPMWVDRKTPVSLSVSLPMSPRWTKFSTLSRFSALTKGFLFAFSPGRSPLSAGTSAGFDRQG